MVWARGEPLHRGAHPCGLGDRLELVLPFALRLARAVGEPEQRGLRGWSRGDEKSGGGEAGHDANDGHVHAECILSLGSLTKMNRGRAARHPRARKAF